MEEGKLEILPEEVIHHIQSFIDNRKEVARTCVLSKSWYSAWSTRPFLSFDERDFRSGAVLSEGFSNFTRKTIQRYQELNLNIQNFRLCMICSDHKYINLATELILSAIKLGANDLILNICQANPSSCILPLQVLFSSASLTKLVVCHCKIDGLINVGVIYSLLTSVRLFRVSIGDDMIRSIILGCPLIENFHIDSCRGLKKINASMMHNLKKFSVRGYFPFSLSVEFEEQSIGSVFEGRINVSKYPNLSSLVLKKVTIENEFFHNLSHKFPCLEDLTVDCCRGYGNVGITSHSLKCISLKKMMLLDKAQFDVPSIHKFKFSVINIPSLSFTTASKEWESDISLSDVVHDVSWFAKLRKFLTELSQSKISLHAEICMGNDLVYVHDSQGFPIPVVENLILDMYTSSTMCNDLLSNLFWSCRPKFINVSGCNKEEKMLRLLWNNKFRQTNPNYLNPNENLLCIHHLQKVNVEYFNRTLRKWQSLPELQSVVEMITECREKIRFRLGWGPF